MVVQNRKIKPGKNGVNYVTQVVDVNNCNFNSIIQENDVGIDGYIEIFDECDVPTGEIVFVQIKTGKSYYNVEKGICSISVGSHREYWMSIQNKVFGIVSGELSGKLYQKSHPYSSHFHVLQESDKYIDSLELNHFITKYEERANRDGKPTNIYCINYGLAKKNNIIWGKPKGNENRTYFIERPCYYTSLILEQIKK